MSESSPNSAPVREGRLPMTEELVALLRHRVATGYYEQPHVVDTVARAVARSMPRWSLRSD
jgi:hypothetical protein